jgi:hypothetical protein
MKAVVAHRKRSSLLSFSPCGNVGKLSHLNALKMNAALLATVGDMAPQAWPSRCRKAGQPDYVWPGQLFGTFVENTCFRDNVHRTFAFRATVLFTLALGSDSPYMTAFRDVAETLIQYERARL